ncbi:hypothetical protein [Eisenbergiella tayi]|uniref:hypothetical protein n=1 Tax=Eisenbergiella tayi TaxID=1432052 RepID=UPI00084887A8|nr:hypothetical protein [Eisenbergiella tayi]ODR34284.1 hypothetical protein BEI60_21045 [Eisenbergiella tayi]
MKKIQVNLSLKQHLLLLLILAAVILSGIVIVRLIPYGSQCKTEIAPSVLWGHTIPMGQKHLIPQITSLSAPFRVKA